MALSYDNLITLQASAKFRQIAAFKFTEAFQRLHRNIPFRENYESDDAYNTSVDNYLNIISVKGELERQIDQSGVLKMPALSHLLTALHSYDIDDYHGKKTDELIDRVDEYEEEGINILDKECTKLLKAYSYRPKKIIINP